MNFNVKVLMIDTALDGHHIAYLKEIIKGCNYDFTLVLPEKAEEYKGEKIITYTSVDLTHKKFWTYIKWLKELSQIAKQEKPDIVHFLVGDNFYKYFGLGLELFKEYKTILTLHWVRQGILQRLSLKAFCGKVDKVVVHSAYLLNELKKYGIKNAITIEYPQFKNMSTVTVEEARKYWKINSTKPVILALGNTRKDKGLDILTEALNQVKHPFYLLIVGKEENFNFQYIQEHTMNYRENVITYLHYLTDEEVKLAIIAADIIALPYRYSFNGASGPLGEGVSCNKCIIGSNHGNLGYTIKKNHLGYTFKTENIDSLANTLNQALNKDFFIDENYNIYKKRITPEIFVKKYRDIYCLLYKEKKC